MAFKKKIDIGQTDQFKFEEVNTTLEGYYIGTFDIVIEGRDVKKHVFQTEAGLVSVLGQTHLTQLLGGMTIGVLIRAIFIGTKVIKKGFNPMKMFDLEYDETQVLDLGTVQSAQGQVESEESAEDGQVEGGLSSLVEEQVEEDVELPPVSKQPPRRPASPPANRPSPTAATRTSQVSSEQAQRSRALLGAKKA